MAERLTVALDAMGGDAAPDIVMQGAEIARERFPDVRYLFFGDEAEVKPLLDRLPALAAVSELRHTSDRISGEAKPSAALRTGRSSSMWMAIEAVQQGEADGVVSAGNTGALMAIAKFILRMPKGVDRPAIAGFFPSQRGETVMLDLGANIVCDAENLVQFAVMGAIFARAVLGMERPRVGLLNVGAEEMKGNEAVRSAAGTLRSTDLPLEFVGFIEGNDIMSGAVDVTVTDGFTGNVALKSAEGTSRLCMEFLRQTFQHSLMAKMGYVLARPAMSKLRQRLDPRRYNGAVFLGLNGVTVKSHGASDAYAFANAIGVAVDMVHHDFLGSIREELEHLSPPGDDARAAHG